ncbi:DUF502 domain-containing protein [soil metagenome]
MRSFLGLLGAGVLVVIPVAATVWVISICYRFISGISTPIYDAMGWTKTAGLEFLTTIVILLGIGFMAKNVFGQKVISAFESFVLALPLVSLVYGAVKQAMESLQSMRGPRNFKRVVYLKYPDTNGLLIGFVTGQCYDPGLQKEFTLVFLPFTPNPVSGRVVAVGPEDIIESGLTTEQVMKMVLSAGLVAPLRPIGNDVK